MEGENGPAPPSPSSSSSPSPPMGGEIGGLRPVRRMGRQESPLSRDTLLTTWEKDTQTTPSELTGQKTESTVSKTEAKSKAPESKTTTEVLKKETSVSALETKSSPGASSSPAEAKATSAGDKPQTANSSTSGVCKNKLSEKSSTPITSKGVQQQQTEGRTSAKPQENTEEKGKASSGSEKVQKVSPAEASKQRKGVERGEKGATETIKVKGPAPPVPTLVQTHAAVRPKVEKASNSYRGAKEEKPHLEVLEENPMSPSSNAASPFSSKSRPMSPGDKASFVTQLTSVAKTVLAPMKGASQDGAKVKDSAKSSEEKRGGSAGKPETQSGRRGAQTTSASVNQSERGSSRSSKHHW